MACVVVLNTITVCKNFDVKKPRGVRLDSTVIEIRQQQLGTMADFLPPVNFSVFDLQDQEVPQVKSQTMWHPLMNLVNTTLSQTYGDP